MTHPESTQAEAERILRAALGIAPDMREELAQHMNTDRAHRPADSLLRDTLNGGDMALNDDDAIRARILGNTNH